MSQTVKRMSKKKFRIGELAKELQIKKFVIRFWEKEFALKSERSDGGQRFYTEDDLMAFGAIKQLLYDEGYTIAGAKIKLSEMLSGKKPVAELSVQGAVKTIEKPIPYIPQDFLNKVQALKEKLVKIKESLNKVTPGSL